MCPPSRENGRSGRSGVAASRHILDARNGSAQSQGMPLRRADRDHEQLEVHVTTTLAHLASVTRRERHRWGVLWPEDGRR